MSVYIIAWTKELRRIRAFKCNYVCVCVIK